MAKRYHSGHYEGMEGRRHEEMLAGGMIKEDRSAIANLPQEVRITPYPKETNYEPEMLDDTINGVDGQMRADNAGRSKHMKPHKY